jgi:MFS family permease
MAAEGPGVLPEGLKPQTQHTTSIDENYDIQATNNEKEVNAKLPTGEPTVEQPDRSGALATEDYSVFTVGQKRAIIFAGSFAAWFSPMTGSIYFPALNQIGADLGVSDSAMSVTVTTYLILQGVAPMMIAGFSNTAGRRPAYILCFTIYIIANLALGLQSNYVALLVLRMVQSAGSSGTVALASGLVGDLVTSSERGQYIVFSSIGSLLGPTVSPVIGGLLSQYLEWHWIFWFLLILSGAFFVPFFLFFPETSRRVVGDGSIPPPWTSWNLSDAIRHKNRAKTGVKVDEEKQAVLHAHVRISVPNPLSTLVIFKSLEAALVLIAIGFSFVCFYAIATGAASVFSEVYGYDEIHIGLVFLAIGGGSIISAFTTGKMIDWNYARHARRNGFPIAKNRSTDLAEFPIERARVEMGLPCLLLGVFTTIGYGWVIDYNTSIAGPVVMLFLLGYALIAGFQCLNVLMVDLYPGQATSAAAANNLVRCLLGAASSAAILPMSDAMGAGWAYTTLALMFLLSCGGLLVIMKFGPLWRKARLAKEDAREKRKVEAQSGQRRKLEGGGGGGALPATGSRRQMLRSEPRRL